MWLCACVNTRLKKKKKSVACHHPVPMPVTLLVDTRRYCWWTKSGTADCVQLRKRGNFNGIMALLSDLCPGCVPWIPLLNGGQLFEDASVSKEAANDSSNLQWYSQHCDYGNWQLTRSPSSLLPKWQTCWKHVNKWHAIIFYLHLFFCFSVITLIFTFTSSTYNYLLV